MQLHLYIHIYTAYHVISTHYIIYIYIHVSITVHHLLTSHDIIYLSSLMLLEYWIYTYIYIYIYIFICAHVFYIHLCIHMYIYIYIVCMCMYIYAKKWGYPEIIPLKIIFHHKPSSLEYKAQVPDLEHLEPIVRLRHVTCLGKRGQQHIFYPEKNQSLAICFELCSWFRGVTYNYGTVQLCWMGICFIIYMKENMDPLIYDWCGGIITHMLHVWFYLTT